MRDWSQTYTGKRFEYAGEIDSSMICIRDIARSLSMQCRYNGHVEKFYSVAEHSIAMSFQVPAEARLYALPHDAAEAYIGDIITPLKTDAMRELEDRILDVILSRYDVKRHDAIKLADLRMMYTEKLQLLAPGPDWDILTGIESYAIKLQCYSPSEAERNFISRFLELMEV